LRLFYLRCLALKFKILLYKKIIFVKAIF